jgi:hypothetical protein
MQDEGVITICGGRRIEARAAAEASERVFEAFLAEDLFFRNYSRPVADFSRNFANRH